MPPRAKSSKTKVSEDVHTTKTTDAELESAAHLKHKTPASKHNEGDLKEDSREQVVLGETHADGTSHKHPHNTAAHAARARRHRFSIDYAARNCKCTGCHQPLAVHTMRVCHISPADTHSYFHASCLLPDYKTDLVTTYGEPAYIEGFEAMAASDQQAFLQAFKVSNPLLDAAVGHAAAAAHDQHQLQQQQLGAGTSTGTDADAGAGAARRVFEGYGDYDQDHDNDEGDAAAAGADAGTTTGGGAAAAAEPIARVGLEPRLTLTVCKDCGDYIAPGEPRLGILVRQNHKYRHVGCVYRGAAQQLLREVGSWDKLSGFNRLPEAAREYVRGELDRKINS